MGRYDDEEDIEEATDEEAPKSTRTRRSADEDDEDDEKEAVKALKANASRVIKRGWGSAEAVKTADSPYAQNLKVGEAEVLVKFLEDDPYISYRQHWINERQGQKSFTCISDLHPEGCPLCDAGHRPSSRFAFNVALLAPGEDPLIRSYEFGTRVIDQIKNFHQSPKTGPISKHYWAISRTGKKGSSQVSHQLVKERDLEEEWGVSPLTEPQLAKLVKQAYTSEILFIPTRKKLQEIAAEELGSD
jgi:hypothetical protein